jgi:hypothetical protein
MIFLHKLYCETFEPDTFKYPSFRFEAPNNYDEKPSVKNT